MEARLEYENVRERGIRNNSGGSQVPSHRAVQDLKHLEEPSPVPLACRSNASAFLSVRRPHVNAGMATLFLVAIVGWLRETLQSTEHVPPLLPVEQMIGDSDEETKRRQRILRRHDRESA